MSKTFLTSDTHFSHANFLKFVDGDGDIIRKFDSVEEMDDIMVDRWNEKVSKNDKIYHLGDLCFSLKSLDRIMPRLNGTKVLIKGNHDKMKMSQYMKYFKDVRSSHRLDRMILTHIPLHPYVFERTPLVIHGHTHSHDVLLDGEKDLRYFNVCVEKHNYYPIDFEEIREFYKENFGDVHS